MELYLVEIRVEAWAAVLAWYRDTLGLRPALIDQEHSYALLEAGSGRIALRQALAGGGPHAVRLTFRVEDLEGERRRLLAAGVDVGEPRANVAEGFREARLFDPAGTPITLFAWED